MSGLRLGIALAWERTRGVALWLVLVLTASSVYAFAVLERRLNALAAPNSAIETGVFGLALPLVTYLLSQRVCDGQRLDRCIDVLARHGADRRHAILGVLLGSAIGSALLGLLLTTLAAWGTRDSPRDLAESAVIALAVGATYACWFGAASLVGKRGGGRTWALILDFVLGMGSSALALPFPRAHARNLLGGEPVLGMPQWAAWLALAAIALFSATRGPTHTAP